MDRGVVGEDKESWRKTESGSKIGLLMGAPVGGRSTKIFATFGGAFGEMLASSPAASPGSGGGCPGGLLVTPSPGQKRQDRSPQPPSSMRPSRRLDLQSRDKLPLVQQPRAAPVSRTGLMTLRVRWSRLSSHARDYHERVLRD
jgi:hypothetical protein